ncbi:hypothetical protein CVT24_007990 [Panaeolus cyanescens]|uniref:pectinesterase n=1 Tax=Panaeolus cyanescens TaxID=181874 RepID=A0A409YQV0_9AGAR|nr:hypothetical protein CVT24_007990 [Panaeolus cyanescens]
MRWLLYSAVCLLVSRRTYAFSPELLSCQIQKSPGFSPLTGCPRGTILVSNDVRDPFAHFHSVQEAILSVPDPAPVTILITAGDYHETLNITRRGPVLLMGQLPPTASVAESFAKVPSNASAPLKQNLVKIWDNNFVHTGMDDATSAVLLVAPSFNASLIGAGPTGAPLQPLFGNVDFKAYNIDFENRAANFVISQALVTDISYANASFYGCSFSSFQDTWYTGRNATTYVVDSIIYGQTDCKFLHLFGFGTAWFQNTILANRACGGGIVAWKGTNLTDAPGNRYGAYIADSTIIRSPDANATTVTTQKCFLGRPWNDLATTVFLRTFMDNSIQPKGWTPFNSARPEILNTTFYAEFDSRGPGGNVSARLPLEHILTTAQSKDFTIEKVFLERPKWIDFSYVF